MITNVDYKDIAKEIINYIMEHTSINLYDSGSVVGEIVDAISMYISKEHNEIVDHYNNMKLSEASGEYLDNIGEIFGVSRKEGSRARSTDVEFYISAPAPSDITINSGTIVNGVNDQGNKVSFITTVGTTISAGDTTATASIESIMPGDIGVIYTGQLNSVSIPNHPEVKVRNLSPINNGRTSESDADYRYRISNSRVSLSRGTIDAIAQMIFDVDGISDLEFNNDIDTTIYIKTVNPNTPSSVLARASYNAYISAPVGREITVLPPNKLLVYLTLNIDNSDLSTVEDLVGQYINNLGVGEELNLNIVQQIVNSVNASNTIGTIIKDAYFVREIDGYNNNYPLSAITKPNKYEKFILENILVG